MPEWTTACPDWAERLRAGRSIIPPPIFPEEAEANLEVMRDLRIVDAPGSPRIGDSCGDWVFDLAASVFGAYDASSGTTPDHGVVRDAAKEEFQIQGWRPRSC